VGSVANSVYLNTPAHLDVSGSNVYVPARMDGTQSGIGSLTVVDVSNPAYPQIVGWTTSYMARAQVVRVVGSYAYVGTIFGHNLLTVVDVSNTASLSVVGYLIMGGWVSVLAVRDSFAYVGVSAGDFVVVNISDPTSMSVVGSASVGTDAPHAVCLDGSYA